MTTTAATTTGGAATAESDERRVHPLVIVGSGPAGWTAAIYGARAQLDPVVYVGVAKNDPGPVLPGGQLMLTTDVENYPGFPDGVTGPEMMQMFRKQAERFGTKVIEQDITHVRFSEDPVTTPHALFTSGGDEIHARAVIISTGATANWLGLESEMRLARAGGGVSACAVCDGALPIFRDRPLAVVGGGDTAMEEATYLTKFASKVYVIHRRDTLRASKVMQERLLGKDNAEVLWNKQVVDVLSKTNEHGHELVRGVMLEDTQTGERSELEVDGLFLAIGHTPATKFLRSEASAGAGGPTLEYDDAGYIMLRGRDSSTNIPGVFAAGDVADAKYRQAVTAAGMGCQALIDAEHWLGAHALV